MRMTLCATLFLLTLHTGFFTGQGEGQPAIHVTPADGLLDEMLEIRVTGLPSEQAALVRATTRDIDGAIWTSRASFLTDSEGVIDFGRDPAISGSYHGRDPMGLLWTMRMDSTLPQTERAGANLVYDLEKGGVVELEVAVGDSVVAKSRIIRRYLRQGVRMRTLRDHGFVGRLFEPATPGPSPAVIVVSGSEGGMDGSSVEAALLASRGYVALALAYFGTEGVSEYLENIPLEYFKGAMDWLRSRKDVDPERLGLSGQSRGGELVLLLASTYSEVKAVVSIVGSHVVWDAPNGNPSWTLRGKPVAHMKSESPVWRATTAAGRPHRFLPGNLAELEDTVDVARAAIEVEKINGAVLLISGKDDQVWPSSMMFEAAVARLESHGHPFEFRHLNYEGVGHMIPIPYTPTTEAHPGGFMLLGGSPEADYRAGVDAWSRQLAFLRKHLKNQ